MFMNDQGTCGYNGPNLETISMMDVVINGVPPTSNMLLSRHWGAYVGASI
jgi:hypothetical protein